jgi:hypothetical protein
VEKGIRHVTVSKKKYRKMNISLWIFSASNLPRVYKTAYRYFPYHPGLLIRFRIWIRIVSGFNVFLDSDLESGSGFRSNKMKKNAC